MKTISLPDGNGSISIETSGDRVTLVRRASRGGIVNRINSYTWIPWHGRGEDRPLTLLIAQKIVRRLKDGEPYSSCFVLREDGGTAAPKTLELSAQEHRYTSTGVKFWRHREAMESYRSGSGRTVVSTHISPEGGCNLKCPYCSVTYRNTSASIAPPVIEDYVTKLVSRGLKAVILTGGGEPTLYRHFNQLVQWLKRDMGLSVALITNGTLTRKVEPKTWGCFSWVRVSINIFKGWREKIELPTEHLDPSCVVGASMIVTPEHEATAGEPETWIARLCGAAKIADKIGAKYVRLLPNCLLEQSDLLASHAQLERTLAEFGDPRFFQQHKVHATPKDRTCHQSFFRPYLSEEPWRGDGVPGSVYPCDSVVLNDTAQVFAKKFQLCRPADILDYMDRKIEQGFDATQDCTGCVFTKNVDMLGAWKATGEGEFPANPIEHEEFV